MNKYLQIIFLLIISLQLNAQDCTEVDLNISEIDSKTNSLEFVVFFENDSLKKICWWKKNTFSAPVYKDKITISTQVVRAKPIEYNSEEMSYRPKAMRGDIYIDGKKIEFHKLCD